MLASLLYPYDDDAPTLVPKWIDELRSQTCIRTYTVDGKEYIEILHWTEHQKIDRPSPSKFPAFVEPSPNVREHSRGLAVGMEGKGKDQEGNARATKPGNHAKPKNGYAVSFDRFLQNCHTEKRKPIAEDDPVWTFTESAGISEDLVRVHWAAFRDRYGGNQDKRYTRWQDVFRRSVKGNWFHVWQVDRTSGQIVISQQGEILRAGLKGAKNA